ncbi:expressed unknown protein [Ectocarpus siliculosus]|uniref:Uncharacterized protein n=1 Tax=Ectocarpus siliculosus TaxID=2880 RepID=D8LRW5_ECTSI|nr:expressed unknown protein [Ectocarpus siliculosus]|eukprot:CBN73882.1 expressed unknown protein [Ectocarpus siliculosus]
MESVVLHMSGGRDSEPRRAILGAKSCARACAPPGLRFFRSSSLSHCMYSVGSTYLFRCFSRTARCWIL